MSSPDGVAPAVDTAFDAVLKALTDGNTEDVSAETVQKLLVAGAKLYCRKLTDEDTYFPPFRDEDGVTAGYIADIRAALEYDPRSGRGD